MVSSEIQGGLQGMQVHLDVIVIGSGPAGEGAAMKCAKSGKRVCVIEQHDRVGGACTHFATIPSKALRQVIHRYDDSQRHQLLHRNVPGSTPVFRDLAGSAASVIDRQVQLRHGFYVRNRVDIRYGRVRFMDPNTVEICQGQGAVERISASYFVIATGSHPYHPPDLDFTHPRIRDSDTVLSLEETPRSITIYGAGVIGSEYASMFRSLGVKVDLINTRDRLLTFLDQEISDALSYHLTDNGVLIRNCEEADQIETRPDCVVLHLKSGKRIKSDVLLWTNGRTGNSADLGLEAIGIGVDSRGNIPVNEAFQTSMPHVYAAGDIVGHPCLASAAYDQGRFAGTHIVEGRLEERLVTGTPMGIYTTPEVSALGKTERELTVSRVPFEVGRAHFRNLARAQITGQTAGMLKILFHRDTLAVLGIHCFGDQACEIIHIGQAIMSQQGDANTLMYFVNTTFNYPTMAEAYRVAALNGLNRVS